MARQTSDKFAYRVDPIVNAFKAIILNIGVRFDDLADATGMSKNAIFYAFNGTHKMDAEKMRKLASALGYKLMLVKMTAEELEQSSNGTLEYNQIMEVE